MNILEILGNLGFDWRMALASLINFLIIFWLLKKYAFGPIQAAIDAREEKIKQGLEDAERAASEVTMAKENYNKKLEEAKQEANKIIAGATEQGKEIIAKSTEDAYSKAAKIITDAKAIIYKEKESMLAEVKKETVSLGIQIAEKILNEKLDEKHDAELIKKLTEK